MTVMFPPSFPGSSTSFAPPRLMPPPTPLSVTETQPNTPSDEDSLAMAETLLFQRTGIRGLGEYAFKWQGKGFTIDDVLNFLRYGTDTDPEGQRLYQEYQRVYPGMADFIQRGFLSPSTPESEYQDWRKTVREAAKAYGLMDSLVDDESIAGYISSGNSAATIVQRMSTAAAAVATTPAETLAVLKDYYNLSNGDLISFYLDDTKTQAELNKRFVAAQIGTEAARQNFGLDVTAAENLVQRGYTAKDAATAFETVAGARGLTQGPGETISEKELVAGQFGDVESAQKAARIAAGRVGGFQGGGEFVGGQQGVAGLGTSATR